MDGDRGATFKATSLDNALWNDMPVYILHCRYKFQTEPNEFCKDNSDTKKQLLTILEEVDYNDERNFLTQ